MPTGKSPRRRRGILIALVWIGFGLVASAQHHLSYSLSQGVDLPWSRSLLLQMPVALVWALATPAILWLGRRFPIRRDRWRLSLPVHIVACASFVFAVVVLYVLLANQVLPPAAPRPLLARSLQVFVAWAVTDGVLYAAVLAVGYVIEHRRRLDERELRASQLEAELAQAELRALKMQLQPHFLFNALHTIGALVRTGDRDKAVRVVSDLGDLLRRVVDGAGDQEVPLARELELIRNYLAIEQVRFEDRLAIDFQVDGAMGEALVPHLILQPLVENAIRHGISREPGAGRIAIGAERRDGLLYLTVRDDGSLGERETGGNGREGVGLANTRARLERLYGPAARLSFEAVVGRGHIAAVALPWRSAPESGP